MLFSPTLQFLNFLSLFLLLSYDSDSEASDSSLHLLSRAALLSASQVKSLGNLPNVASPSDHLPLVASFLWNYGKDS